MKRWLFKVVVFLLLGAIINIAVAWGCIRIRFNAPSSYSDAENGGVWEAEGKYNHWLVTRYLRPGACVISSQWADPDIHVTLSGPWPENRPEPLIPFWASFVAPPDLPNSVGVWHYRWIDARGWPCLALWAGIACDTTTHANNDSVEVIGGFALDGPTLGSMRSVSINQRLLPFYPVWYGFALNSTFYAAGIWLCFVFPLAVRRWRRIKRGLCPKCAYPVGASDTCTECGRPVPWKRNAET